MSNNNSNNTSTSITGSFFSKLFASFDDTAPPPPNARGTNPRMETYVGSPPSSSYSAEDEPKVRFVEYSVDEDYHVLDPNASGSGSSGSFEIFTNYEPASSEQQSSGEDEDPVEFSCRLLKTILRFYSELNVEKFEGNTEILRRSNDFIEFERLTLRLPNLRLKELKTHEQRLSFWLNMYHTQMLHAYARSGFPKVLKILSSFWRFSYVIGGLSFALMDVEHAVLRANSSPPDILGSSLLPKYKKSDPRSNYVVINPERRLLMALSCGSSMCGPIAVYHPSTLESQLEFVATRWTRNNILHNVFGKGAKRSNEITVPQSLKWYHKDFAPSLLEAISVISQSYHSTEDKEIVARVLSGDPQLLVKSFVFDFDLQTVD